MTFYESTHVDTLAHQLLFTGNAVNITGSTLLSSQNKNIATGWGILELTLNQGFTLGEAVSRHKNMIPDQSLKNNWAILGDPSHRF